MTQAKQNDESLVVKFKRFVERRLGILVIIAAIAGAIATFTGNVEKIVESLRKIFRTESQASSGKTTTGGDGKLQVGGGNFAGLNWRFPQGRGIVQLREDKITFDTHRAEALVWVESAPRSDFRFSCTLELVSGDTSLGFGPVFWLKNERNFFHFAIRTAGQYRLTRYRDGRATELIPWTPSPKVRGVSTAQRLKVVAKDNRVELLADDTMLQSYQLPAGESESGRVGIFAVDGGLTVSITQAELE